jgi:hypothetical protein
VQVQAKVQYREVGSGTWLDFTGSEVTGTLAEWLTLDVSWEQGNVSQSTASMSAPTSVKIYEFQLVARVVAGSAPAQWIFPSLGAQWFPT